MVRVVVAAERATVYPAVTRVSEVGNVSGWEGKGRVDGASGRFKQQQPRGPTNRFLLWAFFTGRWVTDGRGFGGGEAYLLPVSLDEAEGELMTGRSRPRGGRGFSADSLLTRGGEWVHTSLTGFYGNPHQHFGARWQLRHTRIGRVTNGLGRFD